MRTFTLTWFDAPTVHGDPDTSTGVRWPVVGRRWTGDLDALCGLLTRPRPGPGKYACPFFLVGAFEGDRRCNAAFTSASVVALDVEGGPTTREAHECFRDVTHLIYTTWRHTASAHRFRVVFPLASDVDATGLRLLWAVLARRLGRGVDGLAKDPARALFLPAVRPDGRSAAAKAWRDAPLLEPAPLLASALRLVRPASLVSASPPDPWAGQGTDVDRVALAARLGAQVRGGRAERVACPRCGRPSAWFWLADGPMYGARCDHRNSCGWTGPLGQLGGR